MASVADRSAVTKNRERRGVMQAEKIRALCKEAGLTYKELAEKIGMSVSGIKNAVSTGKITPQTQKSIELLRENMELHKKLQEYELLRKLLRDFVM